MKVTLEKFTTIDKINLPGLLYEPNSAADTAVIYLHGNGSSSVFYKSEEMNLFAQTFAKANMSFFPFNNRGAHYIKSLKKTINETIEREYYGTTYELIKECIIDIDSAIDYLKQKGYKKFLLMGSSTGANKIVVYNTYSRNINVIGYILLAGGDDTGIYYMHYGHKKFNKILLKCKKMIAEGKARELVPKYISKQPMSYQSIYDTINPDGDYNIFPLYEYSNNIKISKKKLFVEYKEITKPCLVIYGSDDEYAFPDAITAVEILFKQTKNKRNFKYEIINGANHNFDNKKGELNKRILDWLKTL